MQPDSPGVRIPPITYFAAAFAAGVAVERVFPLSFLPTTWIRVVSVALFLMAVGLVGSAGAVMRGVRTSILPFRPATSLVVRGPFRLTRNPMYVSLAFVHVGAALWFGLSWPILLLPPALLGLTRIVIRAEEAYLTRRFGDEYLEYSARVRRWL